MSVEAITRQLNERRIFTRDGGRWGLAQIHAILTRTTYIGERRFNTRSHQDRERKPESEVAVMACPPLIDRETFDAVQARLKSRDPRMTPARITSGPTLLTGLCFCAKCGGAMTLRTGKGGAGGGYRRDHLRALAQRVEVADKQVRIIGSKSELLRTLVIASQAGNLA